MNKPAPPRFLTRFRRDEKGLTAVEFALVAPVMLYMVIGMAELGCAAAAQSILDDATFVGSRVGKTGYSATGQTQAQTITAGIKKAASALLDPAKITLTSVAYPDYSYLKPEPFTDTNKNGKWDSGEAYTDVNGNGKYDDGAGTAGTGAASEIVVYTATYNWKLMTPGMSKFIGAGGVLPLKSRVVVKNEPYS